MSWNRIRLGDIAIFRNGINFGKESYGKGVSLIGVSDFKNRFYPDCETLDEVKESVVGVNDYLDYGDIVFVRSNGNKELVGRCMLIKTTKSKITYSGFCIRTRIKNKTEHDPIFWTYHFKNISFRKSMSGNAVGTNIQNLSQGMLSNYEAEVPDYNTQLRIASILSTYDNLIENNQKQIKLLEEAAQRLYKEWFIDLRFPGHENIEILDGIPLGWYEDTIDTKVNLLNGFAFKSKDLEETGLFKLVTIKNVQDGYFESKNVKYLSKIPDKMPKHCYLDEGDLLLSLTGNVGRVCIVEGNDFLLNQRVAKISSETPAYTYCLFRSNELFIKINNIANGAAQQNVSPIRIGQIKHLFPNDKLIMDFERVAGPILKRVVIMKKNIILLEKARDRLLPKLMSGEIEV